MLRRGEVCCNVVTEQADVMRGTVEPETDGRSGLKSLELLVSLYRSAKDGVKVSLPLDC